MKAITQHGVDMSDAEDEVVGEVLRELARAETLAGPFHSDHEGYAVLKEEVDELWTEVKVNEPILARAEAVQVAAMALRFIIDGDTRRRSFSQPDYPAPKPGLCQCDQCIAYRNEASAERAETERADNVWRRGDTRLHDIFGLN